MKYKQELPKEVEAKLDAYIERIKNIKWFKPSSELKKDEIEKQVNIVLKSFGVEATIEYRKLVTQKDRDAAWGAARDAAWGAARDAARGAAWDAAWDAAWGAFDILVQELPEYKAKYPNGNFINLIPLWEAGLYPTGVIDGKFVIYVPPCAVEFPKELN